METLIKYFFICFVLSSIVFGQSTSNSYSVNQQIQIGNSGTYYVQITDAPSNAVITNVEAKFDYIAYGVVQNYVSARFNRGSDPGISGGEILVPMGNLPEGNPGTFGWTSFNNWNSQSVNSNYYFRFSVASSSPYTATINTIYIHITYIVPPNSPTLTSPSDYSIYNRNSTSSIPISWNSVSGANDYWLNVFPSGNAPNPVFNGAVGNTTSKQLTINTLNNGVYIIQVRAGINGGNWSEYSTSLQFIADTPPEAPTLSTPANESSFNINSSTDFSWGGISGAARYYLRIVQGSDLNGSPSYTNEPISTNKGITFSSSTFSNGAHIWSVKAIKVTPPGYNSTTYESIIGWGAYATARNFTITTTPEAYIDDYPYPDADYNLPDPWSFFYRECTSYAAFKINKDAGTLTTPYYFTNYMNGGHWGDAGNWSKNAKDLGYVVDKIPFKGSIAQWDAVQMPPVGHVAYVEKVNADGSVDLTEYNYPSGHKFNIRLGVKNVPNFIHVINNNSSSLTVTNPLKDYTWNYNSKVKVEWDYSGFTGNVAVDIYKDSTNQIRIVSSVPVTQKYVEFVLPTSLIPGGDYRIGISETPTGNPAAFSDTFSIRKLTVTYPNGGQTFNSGQIVNVKWDYDFVTDNISVDLYKGDSNSTRLISSTPVKDGNKDVTIPIGTSSGSDYRIAISAHGGYVWDFSDNNFTISPSSTSTAILDELDGSTLGNPFGVTYANTPHNQGAVFSRANESRIEYPFSMGLPHEGTVEMQIKVDKGYTYSDYVLQDNQSYAIIFNTGPSDVWYLGAMWLAADNSGGVSLATALTAGPTSHSLSASGTSFRFNEWHIVSFSYGSQGQYLKVDGQLVASNPSYTETLQSCGNWSSARDVPTVGEIKSVFWGNNQYDQGFEGTLDRFRASNAQQDWALNVTDVKDAYDKLPQNYSLLQNYPNPFNPTTSIQYSVVTTQFVSLKVYDVLGNEVATLVNEEKQPGVYNYEFGSATGGRNYEFSSGVYFYQLRAGNFVQTKKMIVLK